MVFIQFIWDLDDDPEGNVQHLLEHDVTKEEAEHVLDDPLTIYPVTAYDAKERA